MAKWVQLAGLTICFALSLWVFHRFAKKQADKERRLLKEEQAWEAKLKSEAKAEYNKERGVVSDSSSEEEGSSDKSDKKTR